MKRKSKKSEQGKYVNQCVLQENKTSTNKQEYKANVYVEDGKNCQPTKFYRNPVCSDKNSQDTHMQLMKPTIKMSYMWSIPRPVMLNSSCKKWKSVYDDQKC